MARRYVNETGVSCRSSPRLDTRGKEKKSIGREYTMGNMLEKN
jgi:hypothetical protein